MLQGTTNPRIPNIETQYAVEKKDRMYRGPIDCCRKIVGTSPYLVNYRVLTYPAV